MIREGDPVLCDLAPRARGYWGDSCNTIVVGEPPAGFDALYRATEEAVQTAVEHAAAGHHGGRPRRHLRAVFDRHGVVNPIHIGHGIGTGAHESPRIVPGETTIDPRGHGPDARARRLRPRRRRRPARVDVPRHRHRQRGAQRLPARAGAREPPRGPRDHDGRAPRRPGRRGRADRASRGRAGLELRLVGGVGVALRCPSAAVAAAEPRLQGRRRRRARGRPGADRRAADSVRATSPTSASTRSTALAACCSSTPPTAASSTSSSTASSSATRSTCCRGSGSPARRCRPPTCC